MSKQSNEATVREALEWLRLGSSTFRFSDAFEALDALVAERDHFEAEFRGADAHIAECQQWQDRHGLSIGPDGSLEPGMNQLIDRLDDALARAAEWDAAREEQAEELEERLTQCPACGGEGEFYTGPCNVPGMEDCHSDACALCSGTGELDAKAWLGKAKRLAVVEADAWVAEQRLKDVTEERDAARREVEMLIRASGAVHEWDTGSALGTPEEAAQLIAQTGEAHDAAQEEIASLSSQLEQERVRLAGCTVAAEGGPFDAKQGDYGWSLPGQKAYELRQRVQEIEDDLMVTRAQRDVAETQRNTAQAKLRDVHYHLTGEVRAPEQAEVLAPIQAEWADKRIQELEAEVERLKGGGDG